ncbi:MAG: hypothetical protein ACE361_14530 [Aureliella sp.]
MVERYDQPRSEYTEKLLPDRLKSSAPLGLVHNPGAFFVSASDFELHRMAFQWPHIFSVFTKAPVPVFGCNRAKHVWGRVIEDEEPNDSISPAVSVSSLQTTLSDGQAVSG